MSMKFLILSYIPGRNINRNKYFGKQFVISTKGKHMHTLQPSKSTCVPQRNECLYLPKDIHIGGSFTIVLLLIASEWKLPERPPRVKWINALLHFHTM